MIYGKFRKESLKNTLKKMFNFILKDFCVRNRNIIFLEFSEGILKEISNTMSEGIFGRFVLKTPREFL